MKRMLVIYLNNLTPAYELTIYDLDTVKKSTAKI